MLYTYYANLHMRPLPQCHVAHIQDSQKSPNTSKDSKNKARNSPNHFLKVVPIIGNFKMLEIGNFENVGKDGDRRIPKMRLQMF